MVELSALKVSSAVDSILVIGPSWVGDMVMAQSLFIALKQRTPGVLIDVLAPSWSIALLERMPEVNRGISLPLGHGQFGFLTRLQMGLQLRRQHYRQAIVLPNSWKSALIPWFAGVPLRSGYIGEARWGLINDARSLDKNRLRMTVQRFAALALPAGNRQTPEFSSPWLRISAAQQQTVIEKFGLSVGENILALCPGAEYGPAKRWPAAYFAEVARQKQAQGWQVWLFGSEKDRDVANEIQALSGGVCRNFTGETTLGQAIDLLSLASVVVSNDSGLMHVAAALDKKLVAIYGSSDPKFTPPLHADALILDLNLDCSPCFKRECPLGHTRCLTEISAEAVLRAVDS